MTVETTAPRPRLGWLLVLLAVAVTGLCSLGIGVRSTYGGRAGVDEPEYLLTAISLGEDGDLDIADELVERRWQAFFDRELPVQTSALPDGRRISPHDPLLPALLALPTRWGGFVAAKATLAVAAGLLAALSCWVAVRRLGVPPGVAAPVVAVMSVSPPLGVYATQVYPELPAALVVMAAIAALTGPLRRAGVVGVATAVTALPWLSVKYAPVAAALAALCIVRLLRRAGPGDRRATVALVAALVVMGVGYLGAHRWLYGGWTSYATGDHFEQIGEFAVTGTSPDLAGRTTRVVGLLVDRGFGIAAWQPAWLLVVPAAAAAVAAGRRWGSTLLLPLAAGYLTATYVALTAHGYWWPGRQLVVVLPLAVLLLCRWCAGSRPRAALTLGLGAVGVLTFGWLLRAGRRVDLTWVTGFESVGSPAYQALRPILPDYRAPGPATWLGHVAWTLVLAALAAAAWRASRQEADADVDRPAAARPKLRWAAAALVIAVGLSGAATDDGSDVRDDDGHQDPPRAAQR